MTEIDVQGKADGVFEPMREIFARTISDQGQGGAALAIYRDGQLVVDLWGGTYVRDSVQLVFSVGKAVVAVAAAMAADRGLLDLDGPIAEYWPEFRRPDVAAITPRMILAHRAGLPAFTHQVDLEGILAGADAEHIAHQAPFWEPGSDHGYHAFTYGTLMGGVFLRALGRTISDFVATEIADTVGIDFWFGAPSDVMRRLVPVVSELPDISVERARFAAASGIPLATTTYIRQSLDLSNEARFLRASFPAVNGIASAEGLARFFEATRREVGGVRLLSAGARDAMIETRSRGVDRVLGFPIHFGSGVQRPFPQFPMLSSSSYGHEAAGGSAAFADDAYGVSVGFTTSVHPAMAGASTRLLALLPSIRSILDG